MLPPFFYYLGKKKPLYVFFVIVLWFITYILYIHQVSLVAQMVKHPPAMQETQVQSLGWKDPLEKVMATHSSIFTWEIPWTEAPEGLLSMGSQRVRHNWASNTFTHTHTHTPGEYYSATERMKSWNHLYGEPKMWPEGPYLQHRKRNTDIEKTLMVAKGEG